MPECLEGAEKLRHLELIAGDNNSIIEMTDSVVDTLLTMPALRTLTMDGPLEGDVGEDWYEEWREERSESVEKLRATCSAQGRAAPVVFVI